MSRLEIQSIWGTPTTRYYFNLYYAEIVLDLVRSQLFYLYLKVPKPRGS